MVCIGSVREGAQQFTQTLELRFYCSLRRYWLLETSAQGLRQQPLHHFAAHVGEAEVTALEAVGELLVVETELVQQRGVEIVDVDLVLHRVEPEVVGLAP